MAQLMLSYKRSNCIVHVPKIVELIISRFIDIYIQMICMYIIISIMTRYLNQNMFVYPANYTTILSLRFKMRINHKTPSLRNKYHGWLMPKTSQLAATYNGTSLSYRDVDFRFFYNYANTAFYFNLSSSKVIIQKVRIPDYLSHCTYRRYLFDEKRTYCFHCAVSLI